MAKKVAMTGNEAMAEAMRQINPDVVAVYPITPATEIVQIFASFVADGLVDAEFIATESEHSAMSVCIGSAAAGARTMTSTSSQGLALMWEMLYIASGLRLPIVMAEVNRTLSSPINIHCDHSDTMGARDSGWIQIFSENAQEAYDNMIQAVRIAEKTLLPIMVTTDGFIISHGMETMELLNDDEVKGFVGEYTPQHTLLDVEHPITVGAIDFTDYFFEHKRQQIEAMNTALPHIVEIGREFAKVSGRDYDFAERYRLIDAEIAIVVLGSTAGTAKVVIDELREKGIKAGLLKIRVFRPFPEKEIVDALRNVKAIAVMDRSDGGNGMGGPVFEEIRSAMYYLPIRPLVVNYIYGLGGRDTDIELIEGVYKDLQEIAATTNIEQPIKYLGVRE
ncbi:pyruvate ferredoxin oxidoreductase [Candidatus Desantisbacteria bacterium CG2_30_40_21]|uniref:Pyruvate ferredoxin oxidoreductase n=5 Tax=unclassified Candidatus Desantisiibacteriota TaxID=3106372 RepID=A0A2M7J8A2_9BACT|nr:MAG: pyruvate ferredoxin oxidoreductase [Candidatus Desantisbacteria bacterium CG2_30_40_21]PIP39795.1 MAG: pyruvate ferredoxin oxidoreductase [Candidatus Desantisbacteria bacterium CG23_combo_of_CG06-09_8_20_14_all_40_23]PIX15581.1 MAG: pyruvate ferredoxin oxidoreductase [Candidatus Desantisbacteria bacterium CG_4_8_14_3_um_filter_40_12]PIY19293.1 MAG: pyruvate ferredoxin oxidoreductase [Candidatus Desantisbacteria bacterium CG_4_10_14_3_um_filter_40_18]PJB27955.1 MAG: pyruvate ferredoxin o